MSSPFKFLDSYQLEDRNAFFGRDTEIEQLYKTIFKTPMLLLYGLSGTGKTSLVQCGLASRFQGPDWYPLFIRRQNNINDSLRAVLRDASKEQAPEDLTEAVSYLFRYYLRPVYLIFDQFEELFILGKWEEQQKFAEDLQALLKAELPCKILLVMREEYLGQLYDFERIIPQLFDYRMRVERMNAPKVQTVLQSSFDQFNISLEPPVEDRLQQITDNISAGKSGIQLPYLQVYLHMLYQEDFARTYGDTPPESVLPPLNFTTKEIEAFGNIESVLEKFLNEQRGDLQNLLTAEFPDLPEGTVRRVLDAFVTDEGTKRPVAYTRDESSRQIELEESMMQLIGDLPTGALTACLEALEKRRLLRSSDDAIELAHDSLAALIDDQRTDDQRQLNEVKTRIANSYRERQRTGEFLSRKQLISLENFLPKIQLEEHLDKFVADSEANANRIERELEEQRQAELEKERQLRAEAEEAQEEAQLAREKAERAQDEANKNARRARRRLSASMVALGFAIIGLIVAGLSIAVAKDSIYVATNERNGAQVLEKKAVDNAEMFKEEIVNRLLREAKVFEDAEQYYYAKQRLDTAMDRDPGNQDIEQWLNRVKQKLVLLEISN